MRLTDCIFCKIIAGKVPTEFLYQDEEIVAFRDIHPLAPQHILIVPKEHIASLTDLKPQHRELVGKLVEVANGLARTVGIADKGYRLVVNCGLDGGQVVPHVHLHLLGGRRMSDRLR
jgi:histidine triad (HIT) family protein